MHWELWDAESGNLVGDYDSEADALAVVRNAVHRHGASAIATLALGAEHDDETSSDDDLPPVVRGRELLDRALSDANGKAAGGP